MRQFCPPLRSLENWYSLTPVCGKKYGNVILLAFGLQGRVVDVAHVGQAHPCYTSRTAE